MADYFLPDDPEAVVIGVDADEMVYLLEEGGNFDSQESTFEVINVCIAVELSLCETPINPPLSLCAVF